MGDILSCIRFYWVTPAASLPAHAMRELLHLGRAVLAPDRGGWGTLVGESMGIGGRNPSGGSFMTITVLSGI